MSIDSMRTGHGARCKVERATVTQDAGGSNELTWATHIDSVRFKIDQQSGDEAERYRRETNRTMFRIYGSKDLEGDIIEADRIVPHEGDWAGQNLDIQSVATRGGPNRMLRYLQIDAELTT